LGGFDGALMWLWVALLRPAVQLALPELAGNAFCTQSERRLQDRQTTRPATLRLEARRKSPVQVLADKAVANFGRCYLDLDPLPPSARAAPLAQRALKSTSECEQRKNKQEMSLITEQNNREDRQMNNRTVQAIYSLALIGPAGTMLITTAPGRAFDTDS
jgi:hypothetical protein